VYRIFQNKLSDMFEAKKYTPIHFMINIAALFAEHNNKNWCLQINKSLPCKSLKMLLYSRSNINTKKFFDKLVLLYFYLYIPRIIRRQIRKPAQGEVYSIQHYGIKLSVTSDRSVVFSKKFFDKLVLLYFYPIRPSQNCSELYNAFLRFEYTCIFNDYLRLGLVWFMI
jgi:hypothetical protein